MRSDFAMMLSSTGCFSVLAHHRRLQMSTEAYHKEVKVVTEVHERKRLLSAIARADRCCRFTRAKIESHFYRYSQQSAWHHLTDAQKIAVVTEFYDNVKLALSGMRKGGDKSVEVVGLGLTSESTNKA